MISHLEEIASLKLIFDQWTKVSIKLLIRHQEDNNGEHTTENEQMLTLNVSIDRALNECRKRLSGEYGKRATYRV